MRFSRALLAAALGSGSLLAAEFKIEGRTFVVPEGFTVERVTGTNLVQRPVSAGFDDLGRLYVTESDGSNDAPAEQVKHPGSRVLRLEDTDADGIFDKSAVFADKVMFPQGCLWHDGWVYVAGPPSIWRFKDADGDGKAELREEWFKGGTLTGCANDIHGPYLGPDGFIYWTKGAFAEQSHKLANGKTLTDKAAHIYRMRPDGTGLDVIMSGGMDNPVEVAFTPEGEALFTSTFVDFTQPGFRDGIAHAVYGGVYGKENDVLDDGRVIRTGPDLLHPFHQAGPAAECGLTRYESEVFGPEYRDNLFATTFNLRKVTRHVLRAEGATFASTDSDFLVCDDVDFHPTDVLEDADGSLLVVDTGGWYKLCCPSSQLVKPDVFGAIYRVRKTGATPPADPRGLNANWGEGAIAQIASRLGDPRPAVRQRAGQILIAQGTNALIVGKPGTGKSHLAKAVAYQATLQGHDVRYLEADTEFARYALANPAERTALLREWVEADLLVLDDLFLARRISEHAAEVLQAIVHQRYKLRRSIVVTSNRVVQDWGRYLGDATMATTILDRLMHRCEMLEFEGRSYRLKEAATRIAISPETS
jgi:putative membrane-bound dehydrogenase-like protein